MKNILIISAFVTVSLLGTAQAQSVTPNVMPAQVQSQQNAIAKNAKMAREKKSEMNEKGQKKAEEMKMKAKEKKIKDK